MSDINDLVNISFGEPTRAAKEEIEAFEGPLIPEGALRVTEGIDVYDYDWVKADPVMLDLNEAFGIEKTPETTASAEYEVTGIGEHYIEVKRTAKE